MCRLGRSTARSTARECLLSGNGPVDQAVDRLAIAQLAVDRPIDRPSQLSKNRSLAVDRQQYRLLSWLPTGRFLEPIKWGSLGLFSTRFQESFWATFSYSYKWFYPHVLESIFPNQKESLSRVFKSDFFEFFTTHSILIFLTHT